MRCERTTVGKASLRGSQPGEGGLTLSHVGEGVHQRTASISVKEQLKTGS